VPAAAAPADAPVAVNPAAPPIAPATDGPPQPAPPARSTTPSRSIDTARALELLLYAVAATIAALTLARGRRVLPFGAVKPRLAFVSSIERPG
jgi:hypothetical protein